jgi:hypothetical protein
MGWLLSLLIGLIGLGLLAALFILAERARSRARRKLDRDSLARERQEQITRADAERDYWGPRW